MKFSELPESSKDRAREALCAVFRNGVNSASAKLAGKAVAAAFIAMEHHDDAPEVCSDTVKQNGQDYS
ncbi:hypothetical protein JY446_24550 [Serratia marcescens]|uniref:hypothetical protein n=1 Tax=Serratia TaxID=613 RepID=UPI0011C08247|nr:hypothetical protein [Serratia marcescens]MBN5232502.1 hypothetical protein [Serratia marcescens]MDK1706843.1 hypothetical protein [Serratia marcescens]